MPGTLPCGIAKSSSWSLQPDEGALLRGAAPPGVAISERLESTLQLGLGLGRVLGLGPVLSITD